MPMCIELANILYNIYIILEAQHSQVRTDHLILTPNTILQIKSLMPVVSRPWYLVLRSQESHSGGQLG